VTLTYETGCCSRFGQDLAGVGNLPWAPAAPAGLDNDNCAQADKPGACMIARGLV
jgi:hypothetical protein